MSCTAPSTHATSRHAAEPITLTWWPLLPCEETNRQTPAQQAVGGVPLLFFGERVTNARAVSQDEMERTCRQGVARRGERTHQRYEPTKGIAVGLLPSLARPCISARCTLAPGAVELGSHTLFFSSAPPDSTREATKGLQARSAQPLPEATPRAATAT